MDHIISITAYKIEYINCALRLKFVVLFLITVKCSSTAYDTKYMFYPIHWTKMTDLWETGKSFGGKPFFLPDHHHHFHHTFASLSVCLSFRWYKKTDLQKYGNEEL